LFLFGAPISPAPLERNRFRLNRLALYYLCWSMIFSENRRPLFRIML